MTIDALALLRFGVGLIFARAVTSKLRHPYDFAVGVAEYGVVPGWASHPVSVLLIVAESWIAVAHLLGTHLWLVAPLTLALLLVFLLAVGTRLRRGDGGNCHCFGDKAPITVLTLVRLVTLIAGEVVLLTVIFSGDSQLAVRLYPPAEMETAYVAAVWLLVCYASLTWLPRLSQIATLIHFKRRSAT